MPFPELGNIITDFEVPFSVLRRAAPTLVRGEVFRAPVQTIPFRGAIVPQFGDRVVMEPEGRRTQASIWIFTQAPLRSAEDPEVYDADQVVYANALWEVERSEDWQQEGGFSRATALKVAQSKGTGALRFGSTAPGALTSSQVLALPGLIYELSPNAYFSQVVPSGQRLRFCAPQTFGAFRLERADGTVVAGTTTSVTVAGVPYFVFESAATPSVSVFRAAAV